MWEYLLHRSADPTDQALPPEQQLLSVASTSVGKLVLKHLLGTGMRHCAPTTHLQAHPSLGGTPAPRGRGREVKSRASPTQAEKVDGAVVQEVADVPGVLGHGAEGVCTAGGEGVHAAGAHVHKQGPGVAVILDVYHTQGRHKPPHEEPAT